MRPCLIGGILPTKAVHLLGGSPGAGKTRLTFGMIDQWMREEAFLGHISNPVPYCFVSLDRPRDSVEETLETMGLKEKITNLVCLADLPKETRNLNTVIAAVRKKYPKTEAMFMEGFQLFAGDFINRYKFVADLLIAAAERCVAQNLTIIGTCHSSKTKKGNEFTKGRDRIGGTIAWSAFSETIIIVDADEKTKVRTVDIYPRNAPEEQHHLVMSKGGVLIPNPKEKSERLYQRILSVFEGDHIKRQWVLEVAEDWEIGESTAERIIKRCVDENQLEPLGNGAYKRTYTV